MKILDCVRVKVATLSKVLECITSLAVQIVSSVLLSFIGPVSSLTEEQTHLAAQCNFVGKY